MFETPLLWQLAERLDVLAAEPTQAEAAPPLLALPRQAHMPVSLSQQRLWLVDRLHGPSASYNMAASLTLNGALDMPALRATFNALLARHEVLRSAYQDIDGEPIMLIAEHLELEVGLRDLSAMDPTQRLQIAEQESLDNLRLPFDLRQAPLIRARVLRFGDQQHLLLLALHHMVADGWSVGVLVNEFSQLYASYRDGQQASLPALAVQYADYAAWQRATMDDQALAFELDYWRKQLADLPPHVLADAKAAAARAAAPPPHAPAASSGTAAYRASRPAGRRPPSRRRGCRPGRCQLG